MKFSERWLREWVNPAVDSEALAAQLTNLGLEVDTLTAIAKKFNKVVVAEILAISPHPEADRLRICHVNAGQDEILTIVTNQQNILGGMKVACALVGAELSELTIKKSKLRGVESHGMFCGYDTLGIGEATDGIVCFSSDVPVGTYVWDYLALEDNCIDVELTPNRGDCLSIAGLARELAVINRCSVTQPTVHPVNIRGDKIQAVTLLAQSACPRFAGRTLCNINPDAITPLWIVERLRRSGIRSIHPVVDVTNYVMLEYGQPMHAYDLNKLNGGITVRYAKEGESLTLLDGQTLNLSPDLLIIADEQHAIGLAGIMGGSHSAVNNQTQHIFLESAYFQPQAILGKARQCGLHTDASHRFERGVDPRLQVQALERATQLLVTIMGGDVAPIHDVFISTKSSLVSSISLRINRIEKLLGCAIDKTVIHDILSRLGMQLEATSEGYKVIPPSYRFDLHIEADLIEEIARIYGYNAIPRQLPHAELALPSQRQKQPVDHLRTLLQARGYHEAMCYSFVDPKLQALLGDSLGLTLKNPISPELSVMRTTLWSGLLQSYLHNTHRQQERIRLFEIGLRFSLKDNNLQQIPTIAGIAAGTRLPEQWGQTSCPIDFYDLKGDIEALLPLADHCYQFLVEPLAALHPGQTAAIYQEKNYIGHVGRLHPKIEQQLKISEAVYLFELNIPALLASERTLSVEKISKFPAIRRDLAIIVEKSIKSQDIFMFIQTIAGNLLKKTILFDVYSGEKVSIDKKSLGIGLILQDGEQTLTDIQIKPLLEKIVMALTQKFGAKLRDV